MMEETLAREILLFLEDYASFYKDFLQLETQKYESIVSNNLELMDSFSSQEQAYKLKARGLEQKRENLLKEAGYEKITFRKLLDQLPESSRGKAADLFRGLSSVILDLKEINLRSIYLVEIRLHRIENMIKKQSGAPAEAYGKTPQHSMTQTVISRKV